LRQQRLDPRVGFRRWLNGGVGGPKAKAPGHQTEAQTGARMGGVLAGAFPASWHHHNFFNQPSL
jgi:hypothetical protein